MPPNIWKLLVEKTKSFKFTNSKNNPNIKSYQKIFIEQNIIYAGSWDFRMYPKFGKIYARRDVITKI